MRFFAYLTLLIILTSCTVKKNILVDIELDSLTIDNRLVEKVDFEEKLKMAVDSLVNSGLNKSMIHVQVTADKRISTHEMSEIEKAIRQQGVTRDYIWTKE